MLEITNEKLFAEVIEAAKRKTLGDARWLKAIDRAADEIRENPMMHWTGHSMLIQSPESAEVYEASSHGCGCKAFEFKRACWHRSAARLWQRFLEALARPARTEATAVLVARASKGERVNGFQI